MARFKTKVFPSNHVLFTLCVLTDFSFSCTKTKFDRNQNSTRQISLLFSQTFFFSLSTQFQAEKASARICYKRGFWQPWTPCSTPGRLASLLLPWLTWRSWSSSQRDFGHSTPHGATQLKPRRQDQELLLLLEPLSVNIEPVALLGRKLICSDHAD